MACAAFLACLAGELLFRFSGVAPDIKVIEVQGSEDCVYKRSNNPVLGFELKSDYVCQTPDFISTYERTNSHGQRDAPRTLQKPAATRRVILLGDSIVEGYGVSESNTISRLLQTKFDSFQSPKTEVLNFGVSAYCTLAEIELLATKGIQFSPDVVVLVFVENDFDNFNREAFPLGQSIERPAAARWMFENSHLFRVACLQLNLFRFRQHDPVQWNKDAIGDNNVAVGFRRFRELANQHQFEPLVVVWPRFSATGIIDMPTLPDSNQLIVESLANRWQLPCLRLSPLFADHFAQNFAGGRSSVRVVYSQGDELHPSPLGASVAAQGIFDILQDGIPASKQSEVVADESQMEAVIKSLPSREPHYAYVYNRLGDQLLKQGRVGEAIAKYRESLNESTDVAATYNNLGVALRRRGNPKDLGKAIEHFEEAIRVDPGFAEAHLNLGLALKASDLKSAKEAMINAVRCKPDFVAAHYSLSKALYEEPNYRAAEAGLREVLKLDPLHIKALRLLGTLLTKQGRFLEAKSTFERLLASRPKDVETLNHLAAICVTMGDREAAKRYLRVAVEISPNHPTAASNLERLEELAQ